MKRVWIYQSSRFFTDEEILRIKQILQEFVAQWTAHGNQLAGSFEIRHHLFIVLCVDEEKAMVTGCSIDKSVHLLKKIEQELSIVLFDCLQIAFRVAVGEPIRLATRNEFEALLAKGAIDRDRVIVFNNMITTSAELNSKWEVPMGQSWHAKIFG